MSERNLPRRTVREDGATAVEYALMVGLIAVVIATIVTTLGLGVAGLFAPVIPAL